MPLNEWYYENMYMWCHESRRPEEWAEAWGSLTVVDAGTMHGFGTDPIKNPTIWLVESRNQVN